MDEYYKLGLLDAVGDGVLSLPESLTCVLLAAEEHELAEAYEDGYAMGCRLVCGEEITV